MDRLEQTICALATPPGEGGIAVIRVSGPDAYSIVEKIFVPVRQGRRVADAKGYTAMLGHYLLRGEEMDETVALFYRTAAPPWPTVCWKPCCWQAPLPQGPGNLPAAPWNTANFR